MAKTGAKALVEALEERRVGVIFGIPGGAVLPICDALYESEIRFVLMRHEQCAAHAADGYARATGRPGVCMSTSGPGATNLLTGLATAYLDSSPVVALTGQVPRPLIGTDAFQEVDIVAMATPVTKCCIQVGEAAEMKPAIDRAFEVATLGRPGPVLVDIPKDVQVEAVEEKVERAPPPRVNVGVPSPRPEDVKRAATLLLNSERPVILAGGGVILSNAAGQLVKLAEEFLIPVATTLMGKGVFPENHPLSLGLAGMHGRPAANMALTEADVILAVGTRFSDRTTGDPESFGVDAKVIHIDIDPGEIGKNVRVDVGIVGDAGEALEMLLTCMRRVCGGGGRETLWHKKVKEWRESYSPRVDGEKPLNPPFIVRQLREILEPRDIVVTEVGQNQMYVAHYMEFYHPRTFITAGGLGTMGFGFPASIGAKIAREDRVVVDVAGDGSFLMTCQDLATCVKEGVHVVVALLNNGYLGMVRQWQELFYGRRYFAVDIHGTPDFVRLAKAFGADAERVSDPGDVKRVLREAFEPRDRPFVIDFIVNRTFNVLPMVPPGMPLNKPLGV